MTELDQTGEEADRRRLLKGAALTKPIEATELVASIAAPLRLTQ